jgi:hypothetical protein
MTTFFVLATSIIAAVMDEEIMIGYGSVFALREAQMNPSRTTLRAAFEILTTTDRIKRTFTIGQRAHMRIIIINHGQQDS